ncbi:hypothetical protein GA0070604_3752 [Micromonospora eburnea]|uniref:Uncharacterized protein n=1 Tax=Micromonospora eburnea TaxID=227316 RepID=A0A1C6UW19_9ACTN|nr:hypothetical protein GA0070604_3752 [Micromonospora eburnea]
MPPQVMGAGTAFVPFAGSAPLKEAFRAVTLAPLTVMVALLPARTVTSGGRFRNVGSPGVGWRADLARGRRWLERGANRKPKRPHPGWGRLVRR